MSPLGSPCPKLVKKGTFYFCGDYEHRPKECAAHKHPMGVCPIGVAKLALEEKIEQISRRIDTGYAMLTYGVDDPDEAYELLVNQWGKTT